MHDETLAQLVAADLTAYLRGLVPTLEGPVCAVSLWTDCSYGQFTVNVLTQTRLDLLTRPRTSTPRHRVSGPAADRWNSAEFDVFMDEFLSPATETALRPLVEVVTDDTRELDASVELVWLRWNEIGFRALQLARPLDVLPTAAAAIAYVETPDVHVVEHAEDMLRTVSATLFHEVFPEWRELADEVRRAWADAHRMDELEALVAAPYRDSTFPRDSQPAPDRLTYLLQACALGWHDVTQRSDGLVRALAVADRT